MGKHTKPATTARAATGDRPGTGATARTPVPVTVVPEKKNEDPDSSPHQLETNPYHRPFSDPDSI